MWSDFFVPSKLLEMWRNMFRLRTFWFCKSKLKSRCEIFKLAGKILTAHKSRPHFGNPRTWRILGNCFKNHTCERRLTIECLKLIQYQRRLLNRLVTSRYKMFKIHEITLNRFFPMFNFWTIWMISAFLN